MLTNMGKAVTIVTMRTLIENQKRKRSAPLFDTVLKGRESRALPFDLCWLLARAGAMLNAGWTGDDDIASQF
jgi:hypothetical protein